MSMSQNRARARELEQRFQSSTAATGRRQAFEELVKFYGEILVVKARRQAVLLGLEPAAGDAAMSEAFICLVQNLKVPWPQDQDFLDRFKREIWKGLRHRRARVAKLRVRFSPLSDEVRPETPEADPERRYRSREQLHRVMCYMSKLSRTHPQRRLMEAWQLSKLGYGWAEVNSKLEWSGNPDSLRASVSRFFNRMKAHLQKQTG